MSDWTARPSETSDIPQMRALWKLCFPEDDEAFLDRFFAINPEQWGFVLCKGEPLAMLFLLPATASLEGEAYPIRYLYAGCTHPAHRSQGLYAALMAYAATWAERAGVQAIYLHPATESLYEYYFHQGYQGTIGWWQTQRTIFSPVAGSELQDYFAARKQVLARYNQPVFSLLPPFSDFFLAEMVGDGWLPIGSEDGCGLLSSDKNTLYDGLGVIPHTGAVCGIDCTGTWQNTAVWLPLGDTKLVAKLMNKQIYTAFLGDM